MMDDRDELFSPIKSTRTFEEISEKIKELIFNGTLKPGDKLPSEVQLSHKFNVGRQTIREALRLLEYSGFIIIKQGGKGGPIIKDTIISSISSLYIDASRMKKITLQELEVARLEIEKMIAGYAFDNAEPSDLAKLKENVARARKKIDRGHRATEENFEFHDLLAKASKNHMFVLVMRSVMAVHADLISRIGYDLEVSENVVTSHKQVLEAFENRDRKKVIHLIERHLVDLTEQLQTFSLNENRAE